MNRDNLEYNSNPENEYTALPDEYLQSGVFPEKDSAGSRRVIKKFFMYTVSFLLIIMVIGSKEDIDMKNDIQEDAVSSDVNLTESEPEPIMTEPVYTDETKPETEKEDKTATYACESGILYYTVYNETFGNGAGGEEIIDEGQIPVGDFADGYVYTLPQAKKPDGYTFLGWVLYYNNGKDVFPQYYAMDEKLTEKEVELVKPDDDGNRTVEIHAAWGPLTSVKWPNELELNANGGTIDGEISKTFVTNTPKASAGNVYFCVYPVPVREGYRFAGWYKSADGEGRRQEKMLGANFFENVNGEIDWNSPKKVILYAAWEKEFR